MKRAHLSKGAPAEGSNLTGSIAGYSQREMEFREEQGAFPSATWERGGKLRTARRSGFTLMEMVIVLLIIALLFTVSLPSLQTAFVEQALRNDSHQLALMVKTAMIQSAEQHRNYVIELNSSTVALHPQGEAAKETDDTAASDAAAAATNPPPMLDVSATDELDAANKLLVPDPDKVDAWMDMPQTTWTFEAGQLCPATRVRMSRGNSWVEMTFSALTGNVENETSYFP